jgi:hypothetical protein
MAVYTYIPSGGAIVGSCCIPVTFYRYYALPFGPRDTVFVKTKAEQGILEKIVIKKYILQYNYGQLQPIYKDTLNRLWFEE